MEELIKFYKRYLYVKWDNYFNLKSEKLNKQVLKSYELYKRLCDDLKALLRSKQND